MMVYMSQSVPVPGHARNTGWRQRHGWLAISAWLRRLRSALQFRSSVFDAHGALFFFVFASTSGWIHSRVGRCFCFGCPDLWELFWVFFRCF